MRVSKDHSAATFSLHLEYRSECRNAWQIVVSFIALERVLFGHGGRNCLLTLVRSEPLCLKHGLHRLRWLPSWPLYHLATEFHLAVNALSKRARSLCTARNMALLSSPKSALRKACAGSPTISRASDFLARLLHAALIHVEYMAQHKAAKRFLQGFRPESTHDHSCRTPPTHPNASIAARAPPGCRLGAVLALP